MKREDFTIYGIQNPKEIKDSIKLQDFEALCIQFLEVQPMFKAVKDIYMEKIDNTIQQTSKLPIQTIFEILHSAEFIQRTPRFLNNMYTSQSIKIIESSIIIFLKGHLRYEDIRNAVLIFILKEMEHQTTGLPLNEDVINNLLMKINKVISQEILKEWIKNCNEILEYKGIIQIHEFLYLVCNSVNRHQYIEKIPKIPMDIERDKYGLFKIEASKASTQKNPDEKIQNYMKYQYNLEKAAFDGRQISKKEEQYMVKRKNKIDQILKNEDNFQQEFRSLLRDQQLYEEIKVRLRNANQLINQAKINGNLYKSTIQYFTKANILLKDSYKETEESDIELETSDNKIGQKGLKNQKNENKIEIIQQNQAYVKKQLQRPQNAFITQVKQEVNLHRQMQKDEAYCQYFQINKKRIQNTQSGPIKPQQVLQRPSTSVNRQEIFSSNIQMTQLRPLTSTFQSQNINLAKGKGMYSDNQQNSNSSTQIQSRPISSLLAQTSSFSGFHKRMLLSSAKQNRKDMENLNEVSKMNKNNQFSNMYEELEIFEQNQYKKQSREKQQLVPFGNINKKNYSINLPWQQQ